jgi:putative endonuclease
MPEWLNGAVSKTVELFFEFPGFESLSLRKMFYTYILKSIKDRSYYYGSTNNLNNRLLKHNSGKVRYTKGYLPYKIHYYETYETRSEAMKRERFSNQLMATNG